MDLEPAVFSIVVVYKYSFVCGWARYSRIVSTIHYIMTNNISSSVVKGLFRLVLYYFLFYVYNRKQSVGVRISLPPSLSLCVYVCHNNKTYG